MKAREPMVIYYVRDMARATKFYSEVFDAPVLFESPGWTELDFGDVKLALHILHDEDMGEAPIPHAGINFMVDDIEELQRSIQEQGGEIWELREPDDFVPVRVASVRDCEGNGFELRQVPTD
ncbi:MAG: hypothetical protein F4W90_03540 [Gammaproteobacteria bacterium]|nr:hypothetical protein [Gammaproteobacteria bacterium]